MCAPLIIPLVGLAIGAIGTIMQSQQQNQQITQQQTAVNQNAALDQQGLSHQREEINEVHAEEQSDAAREAMILRGKVRVAQGETGGFGNTSARLLRDIGFQEGLQVAKLEKNTGRQLRQVGLNSQQVETNRSNSIAGSEMGRPTALGTGLAIAGQAAGAGASIYSASKARKDAAKV